VQNKKEKLNILKIIRRLRESTKNLKPPMVPIIEIYYGKDSFLILVSCILSLRSRDSVTLPVCLKLFSIAKTPKQFLNIPLKKLEEYIKSVNYYKSKAKLIHEISSELINRFNGVVPNNERDLLSLKGVGRKTTNLVLSEAFDIPALYVDTHVHKLSNRLGLIETNTPFETEIALKKSIPKKYWREWCTLLVTWGQNGCRPISPFINKCPASYLRKKDLLKFLDKKKRH
jgi:endonuclease III